MSEPDPPTPDPPTDELWAAPGRTLTPAARRALEEAAARRAAAHPAPLPPEQGGPSGPEPTRYGDWEKNGIASDF
jgi:hypothetical protein